MVGVFDIEKNRISLGRNPSCDLNCNIEELSSEHISIEKNRNETLLFMQGKNGGYINGKFTGYGDKVKLKFSDEIDLFGVKVVWLDEKIAIFTADGVRFESKLKWCKSDTEGDTKEFAPAKSFYMDSYFSKTPRTFYPIDTETVELDAPPQKGIEEKQSMFATVLPALTMSFPMIIGFSVSRLAYKGGGSTAFMYTGIVTALCSAMLGVFMAVTNIKNRHRQLTINEGKRQSAYREYVRNCENTIREKYNKNISSLRVMYPDIFEYVKDGINSFLLWGRESVDEDFLYVRLGTGNIPCDINVSIPKDRFSITEDNLRTLPKRLKSNYSVLRDVPITVDLRQNRITSIVSENKRYRGELFLSVIMNIAVSISPSDLRIIISFDSEIIEKDNIKSIRFLPHIKNVADIRNREECSDENKITIIFTDSYEKDISKYSFLCNTYFVIVSDRFDKIPVGTSLIIQHEPQFSGYLNITKDNKIRRSVHFDRLSIEEADEISRTLQSVRVRGLETKYKLPDKISFFELTDIKITEESIICNWINNDCFDEIIAPIGVLESGEILKLNLHEKGMGPHGLIAGMTGSGKSEILQTLILALCMNYSPSDVGLFLIDYKGGGMSKLFESVPHVMGSISNLSGRMIERAMVSVKSENERRQRRFNDVSVNNISSYQRLYKTGVVNEPMPHIFIIIDEFAELKKEEPEFMKELISVARVGRSLGVHLILATQKPAGVVDENILSNSRFRICLRVQDRMDSVEMIKTPDAMNIINPGRAILQVGNDEIYSYFQGAYTMEKSNVWQKKKYLKITDCQGKEYREGEKTENTVNVESQLSSVTKAIIKAQETVSMKRGSPLWLKPLEKEIYTKPSNQGKHFARDGERFEIGIGVYDNPTHQEQGALLYNIKVSGNLVILGGLQSGKSTLLSVISKSIITNSYNDFFNLYFIDFSNGLLRPYIYSKMCCGYVCEDNEEDIGKLINHIKEIIISRKEQLAYGNYWQYMDGKTVEDDGYMPPIIIVIDGFGNFRERTEGRFDKDLENILKTSEALGILVYISAINMSSHEMPKRLFDLFKTCIPLGLKDRYEYKEALGCGNNNFALPEETPGRGLIKLKGDVVEFQTYQTIKATNDLSRNEQLIEEIKAQNLELEKLLKERTKNLRNEMPIIPKNLTINSFHMELLRRGVEDDGTEIGIPAGFFTDSGKIYCIPYVGELVVVISGRSGSGKRNLLKVVKYEAERHNLNYVNQNNGIIFENNMEVIIMDDREAFEKIGEIKKKATDDPYVIHLGGAVDRQNAFDFSYLSYSKQIAMLNPGNGIVRRTNKGYEYGNVIFPEIT
ncbi:MAG: FtsK/SpoIIIE domain-containing protein [Lachnospiraceae bacterium]|nr:FtsK/SpoIIIE domain-containing protein [Lachnospiraceae bacterium]